MTELIWRKSSKPKRLPPRRRRVHPGESRALGLFSRDELRHDAASEVRGGDTHADVAPAEMAQRILEESVAAVERDVGRDSPDWIANRTLLGGAYAKLGRFEEAVEIQKDT